MRKARYKLGLLEDQMTAPSVRDGRLLLSKLKAQLQLAQAAK